MYKGFCFLDPSGDYCTPPVNLKDPQEVYNYTQLHGKVGVFREIRITDSEDFTVVQMIDGKYTFPEEWKKLNESKGENK